MKTRLRLVFLQFFAFPFLVEFENVANVFVLRSKLDELKHGPGKIPSFKLTSYDFQGPREKPLIR